VTRGNVFSLASYPSPGFYVIWRRTLVNNAGQHPTATDSQSSLSDAVPSAGHLPLLIQWG
jgi:hypothetical protein